MIRHVAIVSCFAVFVASANTASGDERAFADPDARWIARIDVRALRASALADEVEAAYVLALPILEGSLAPADGPACRVDSISAYGVEGRRVRVHLFGSFGREFLAVQRGTSDPSTATFPVRWTEMSAETLASVGQLGRGLGAGDATWRARPCDATHWVLGSDDPDAAECAVHDSSPSGNASFDERRARGPIVVSIRTASPNAPAGHAWDLWTSVVRLDSPIVATTRVELGSETRAATTLTNMTGGESLPTERVFGTIHARITGARVSGGTVEFEFTLDPTRLADAVLAESAENGERRGSASTYALEPMAELEAFRERRATQPHGLVVTPHEGALRGPPVVTITGDLGGPTWFVERELVANGHDVYAVEPPSSLPDSSPIWPRYGAPARQFVDSAIRGAPGGDPCAEGCVIVGGGTAAEIAYELATLDPSRYRAVLLVAPTRPFPVAPLVTVDAVSLGLPVRILTGVGRIYADDESAIYAQRLATIAGLDAARITSTEDVSVVVASLERESRATRPGRVRDTLACPRCDAAPRGTEATDLELESLASSCHGGLSEACHSLGVAWIASTPEPPVAAFLAVERACTMGSGDACSYASGWYEREDDPPSRDLEAIYLDAGCDAGSSAACNDLGILFVHPRGLPSSRLASMIWYGRACAMGLAHGCANLDDQLRSGGFDSFPATARRETFTTLCDGGEWDACVLLAGSALGANPDHVNERLAVGCDRGHAASCTTLADQLGVSEEGDAAFARSCTVAPNDACADLHLSDARRRTIARAWFPTIKRSCREGDRHACVAVLTFHGAGLGGDARGRTEALGIGCEHGIEAFCATLGAELASRDRPRAIEMLRLGCELGASEQCSTLRGLERDEVAHAH